MCYLQYFLVSLAAVIWEKRHLPSVCHPKNCICKAKTMSSVSRPLLRYSHLVMRLPSSQLYNAICVRSTPGFLHLISLHQRDDYRALGD